MARPAPGQVWQSLAERGRYVLIAGERGAWLVLAEAAVDRGTVTGTGQRSLIPARDLHLHYRLTDSPPSS